MGTRIFLLPFVVRIQTKNRVISLITVTAANFGRYNNTPEHNTRIMAKSPRVNNAVVCQGDSLEVTLCVSSPASHRGLSLKTLQTHISSRKILPCTEYYGHSECAENPLESCSEMKGALVRRIHLFIVPSSSPWLLSLWFSALRAQKLLRPVAVPRWLVYWLEPEGKRRKQRTP